MKQKKINKEIDPVWALEVNYDSYTDVTRHADPDERWDGDDLAYSQTIHGYSIHNKNSYGETFPMVSEPDKNKTYWLVYVNYSTGDSFHHKTGCICFVDIFENASDAEHLAKLLEEDAKTEDLDFKPLKVKFPSGIEKEICTSTWKGYFETLENVCVQSLRYLQE